MWTDDAVGNLEAIFTYVAIFNPDAASRLAGRLVDVADSLTAFPNRGRDVGDGRREITTVWPYVLRYRVSGADVIILRIRHGAQDEDAPREQ